MGRRKKSAEATRVFIVQDKSGSMGSRRFETISGFNEYKTTLVKEAEGDVYLSLIQFDTAVTNPITNRKLEEVSDLTEEDFVPGGMTALRDGVGRAIVDAERTVGDKDRVLIVIMTDGGENSSREYTHDAILKQIQDKRGSGWEFVFLGAGEEAWNAGVSLGIADSHVINYGSIDPLDHKASYDALASVSVGVTRGANAAFDVQQKAALENKAKSETNSTVRRRVTLK